MSKSPFKPFTGRGEWLDRAGDDRLSHQQRCDRLRDYLRSHDKSLPEELIAVLAYCENAGEFAFIYPIVTTSGWRAAGARTLSNGTHKILVQEPVAGHAVDFIIEDSLNGRRVAFEVEAFRSYLPGDVARDRLRWNEIARCVHQLVHVRADQARHLGQQQRALLCKVQVERLKRFGIPDDRPPNLRYWPGRYGYDVTSMPIEERPAFLRDWLQAKNVLVPEDAFEAAKYCNHAGEVFFLAQMASLPETRWDGRTCLIGDRYHLKVCPTLTQMRVSFGIRPGSAGASQSKAVVIIDPPHSTRDIVSERIQDEELRTKGFRIFRTPAENAKQLGFRWKQHILNDLQT